MPNRKIILIGSVALVVIIACAGIYFFVLRKSPSGSSGPVGTTTTSSTGSGAVSNTTGGSSSLGSTGGTVGSNQGAPGSGAANSGSAFTVTVNKSNPYALTAPRGDQAKSTSSSSGAGSTALNPNEGSSSSSNNPTPAEVAAATGNYNYSQSDSAFLNSYYPDASHVINGNAGPSGNAGQAPGDQVAYQSTAAPTGPSLTPVSSVPVSSLKVGTANDNATIVAYLNALHTAAAEFDFIDNTSVITEPLSSLNQTEANTYRAQSFQALQSITSLTVPPAMEPLAESYIAAYQDYVNYMNNLSTFISSGLSTASASANAIQNDVGPLTSALNTASTNYQNAAAFYLTPQ